MLERYKSIKQEIIQLQKQIQFKRKDLLRMNQDVQALNYENAQTSMQRQKKIEALVEEQLNDLISQVPAKFNAYYNSLEMYKRNVHGVFNGYRLDIQQNLIIDSSEYDKKFKILSNTYDRVNNLYKENLDINICDVYGDFSYSLDLYGKEIQDIEQWLKYFNHYDVHDNIMDTLIKLEDKVTEKEDNSFLLAIISVGVIIIYSFKFYFCIPFLVFIGCTLFIRVRQFYYLLKLSGILKGLQQAKTDSKNYYKAESSDFIREQDRVVQELLFMYDDIFKQIKQAIDNSRDNVIKNIRDSFDVEAARIKAGQEVENTSTLLEDRIKQEQQNLNELEEQIIEDEKHLADLNTELKELRERIHKSYEELEPEMTSYTILNSFFLGFDNKDEPVTFEYNCEPKLIVYSSDENDQQGAMMSTVKMMCAQIMCAMNPLAYKITVIDLTTGGAPLSAFQVTSELEDKITESPIFSIVSTSSSTDKHIEHLYEVYNERYIRILSNFESIKEYNDAKIQNGARTVPYNITIFYGYDYNVFTNEKLKQLMRIGKSVGIVFMFTFDLYLIEGSSELAREKGYEHSKRKYSYKMEILEPILDQFQEENIIGFNITDSVELITLSKKNIYENVETNF